MQKNMNSSSLLLKDNSFFDNKSLKNEIQEEKTQSNISLKNDNSVSFSQINESQVVQSDEDSIKNIWQDSENILNILSDFSEEFPFLMILNDKNPLPNNKLNINIEENNISIDKSSSFNQSKDTCYLNELNEIELCLNMSKSNEDEEKMSGYSGDSFLSGSDISPNQEFINYENNDNNDNNDLNIYIIEGGKNDLIDINIGEPIEEMKEKGNLPKNDLAEEKKIINFLVSKKDNKNKKNNISMREKKKTENEFLNKKREKSETPQISQIRKNCTKYNNLHEINKVTVINAKAYKCECGKIFSTEENQRLHYINIHLHEKPYNCSFCGEGFSHRNGKIYHERVYHTFIFPYPCKLCKSAFASKSAMIYHMKSKHKIN